MGKSIFAVALGTSLAMNGSRVALVDLDLGAANLHTYLGIIRRTPSIADFILKKASSLEDILVGTSQENLKLISGAEFVPGMANPAHWMKLKIMRHVKALPTDYVIIDLGAGVHFNTLDFFGMSDRGIVVTAPEPGAVMNAYSFIKGAFFRKMQNVFRKHGEIGQVIDAETRKTGSDSAFTLEKMTALIRRMSPEMLPLINEIEQVFSPVLVINKIAWGEKHVLVQNLIALCREKLGLAVEHAGNLPDIPEIGGYLLRIPDFLQSREGKPYLHSVKNITKTIMNPAGNAEETEIKKEFTDEDIEAISSLMESLDNSVFSGTGRETWKLRMFFKPAEVVSYLISRGVTHAAFYK